MFNGFIVFVSFYFLLVKQLRGLYRIQGLCVVYMIAAAEQQFVVIMRNTEITNWNTIKDFRKPLPEEERRKPDFKIFASFELERIEAGYMPAKKLISMHNKNNDTKGNGLNNKAVVSDLPETELKTGKSQVLITTESIRAMSVRMNDSPINLPNNCDW